MIVFELSPQKFDSNKSYYGKAHVLQTENGYFLQSYQTIVAGIVNGKFIRFWDGYSATTQKHINSFCKAFSMDTMNKTTWEKLPITKNIFF